MITCSKTYADIPFAHRQHNHDGHCAFIHGHNWSITLTFACETLDENGFVIDFGGLKFIKEWIDEHLDHACVFNADDPLRAKIIGSMAGAYKPYVVDNCSSEGLARDFLDILNPMVQEKTDGRVHIKSVRVAEDSKNSAEYTP